MVLELRRSLELQLADASPAPWSQALDSQNDKTRRIPQTIAHRGHKVAYPENTMAAFRAAAKVGAHAIETDLHLSRDGVVVLSHDGTLNRCFGVDRKINECDWSYLSTLRTTREPKQPMPTLTQLLEYLARPEHKLMWLLLDIKTDDSAAELLTRVADVIKAAPTADSMPWNRRIIFGCWNEGYVDMARTYLPNFPLAIIGFSIHNARKFLAYPNVCFNIFQKVLVGPAGNRFVKDVRAADRSLFVWTVNEEHWMEWCLRKEVDGVITDDPELFLEVCRRAEDGHQSFPHTSVRRKAELYFEALGIQLLVAMCMPFVRLFRIGAWGKRTATGALKVL